MSKTLEQLHFDNSYARLPEIFFSRHQPCSLKAHHLVHFNKAAAELIELDETEQHREDFLDILTAVSPLPGFDPVAMCYAGHQFGHFVPRLGDGRAIMLGEVKTSQQQHWEMQLKGAGLTEYSRDGDGRAVLRSTIREYLCSAAMHGLGIATTHALFMTGSSEEVYREDIETGSMLLRMAPSHVRFGSFEYFFYTQRYDDLKVLADYVLQHDFPDMQQADNPYLELLSFAIRSTAGLIANWQAVGFSHGVMNTDNMSILGLTLDYGPFGFMEQYDPGYVCNHSDYQGRYAFNKQPEIGLFNVSCLAQALLPLLHENTETAVELAKAELEKYQDHYTVFYAALMRAKLGLLDNDNGDQQLLSDLLGLMQKDKVDYTMVFRHLSQRDRQHRDQQVRDLFIDTQACDTWLQRYQQRLDAEDSDDETRSADMLQTNPKFILRNYMAEIAIKKARDEQDYSEIDALMQLMQAPYDEHPEYAHYAGHPPDWAQSLSVSCSS